MTEPIHDLIDRLRHELHQYGEILALLDQQQEFVVNRSAEQVLQSVGNINQQMQAIQTARQEREDVQRHLAESLGQTEDPAFASLLPLLPNKYRAAVASLVRENNELLMRVQRRAHQNHLLLSRSMELMHQFLSSLTHSRPPTTYNESGRLHRKQPGGQKIYEAVG